MEFEDDIYGEDIYGGNAATQPNVSGAADAGPSLQSSSAVEIAKLKKQIVEGDEKVADLEAHLLAAQQLVAEWQNVFQEGTNDASSINEPTLAVAELKRMRMNTDKQPVEDVSILRQREAALQMQLAEQNLENIELRRHSHTARQYADPNISQIRQLLLDPAVEKEFVRAKTELEEKAKEVKSLQEELQAVQFSQDSKAGRMLMAKCRALQDENEEMGKELAEGKMHSLERQVELSKGFVEEMRARYLELEDHAHALDDEAEDLHQQVFVLKRQLREVETRAASTGRERTARQMQPGPKGSINGNFGDGQPLPGPPGGLPSRGGLPLHSPEHERKRGPPLRDLGMDPSYKRMRG